jgi:4-hydroxy-3-methylbut-2-enyl diphosphate reductase
VRVATVRDVSRLRIGRAEPVAFVVQTGTALEDAAPMVSALRSRWPARAPHPDSWCHAASDRAAAVRAAAVGCDVVVVLGQAGTDDTEYLGRLVLRECPRAHVAGSVADLSPAWLTDASAVGVVAAVSAPARLVREFVDALAGLGPVSVVRRQVRSRIEGAGLV